MGLIRDALSTMFPPLPSRAAVIPAWRPGFDNFSPYAYLANGQTFPLGWSQTLAGDNEEGPQYGSLGNASAFMGNSIVFACMAKRMSLFSEARARYQRLQKGKPGDLWGDATLDILDHPWEGGAMGDLLARADQDVSWAGNFYATLRGGAIYRMRPDWVNLIIGGGNNIESKLLGLAYYEGGEQSGVEPVLLQRSEFAHYAPYPDPYAKFLGMSWLTPIIREIASDNATTNHKLQFFRNGATPNMIVKRGVPAAGESFTEWVAKMREASEGTNNAYKTFYMSQGADATVVGKDFQQIELRATQGAGEVRIVIASGLHPVIVGVSESLQGSSLNSGNFGAARRLVADTFLRPGWRNFFSSMEMLVKPPPGNRLWYDDTDIPFLREDAKDAADIEQIKARTIASHVDKGFTRESAVAATAAQNITLLKPDPDWVSVQVQAGANATPAPAPAPTNGSSKMPMVPEPKRDDDFLLRLLEVTERRPEPPVITINPSPVTVHAPEQPVTFTFERGAFEAAEPPVVNVTVEPTPVVINNTVESTPVNVTVEPTPVSITNEIPAQRAMTKTVKRNKQGEITAIVETPEG